MPRRAAAHSATGRSAGRKRCSARWMPRRRRLRSNDLYGSRRKRCSARWMPRRTCSGSRQAHRSGRERCSARWMPRPPPFEPPDGNLVHGCERCSARWMPRRRHVAGPRGREIIITRRKRCSARWMPRRKDSTPMPSRPPGASAARRAGAETNRHGPGGRRPLRRKRCSLDAETTKTRSQQSNRPAAQALLGALDAETTRTVTSHRPLCQGASAARRVWKPRLARCAGTARRRCSARWMPRQEHDVVYANGASAARRVGSRDKQCILGVQCVTGVWMRALLGALEAETRGATSQATCVLTLEANAARRAGCRDS